MSVVTTVTHPHGHEHESAPTNTGFSNGLLGVMCFLTSEMALFGSLIFAYLYVRRAAQAVPGCPSVWPTCIPGTHTPYEAFPLWLATPNTIVLLSSGVTMHFAFQGLRQGNMRRMLWLLVVTIILGVGFLSGQVYEYSHVNHVAINTQIYGATFFTLTGLHGIHVTGGVIFLLIILRGTLSGKYNQKNTFVPHAATLYWHFVDAVWVVLFSLFYLTVPGS